MSKSHRSVVIDDEDINAYSPDYEDESQSFVTNEESQEDRHNNEEELDELDADDNAALLDEEEARLRLDVDILWTLTRPKEGLVHSN